MSALRERTITVNGQPCRVWEKGDGPRVGYLAGFGGSPRWSLFLDRLSEDHRVIVPSVPGFPGATGHDQLDDLADWVTMTLDLCEGAGLAGSDLIGASVGGMLAAEAAAFSRATVRRLVLIAPYGLFDVREPITDIFAQKPQDVPGLLCAKPETLTAHLAAPEGVEAAEWLITLNRASEAAARLLWPLGHRGLRKRLHRISARTLVLWGADDRVIPPSYAKLFAESLGGQTQLRTVAGAGHLADLDAPGHVAGAIRAFLA